LQATGIVELKYDGKSLAKMSRRSQSLKNDSGVFADMEQARTHTSALSVSRIGDFMSSLRSLLQLRRLQHNLNTHDVTFSSKIQLCYWCNEVHLALVSTTNTLGCCRLSLVHYRVVRIFPQFLAPVNFFHVIDFHSQRSTFSRILGVWSSFECDHATSTVVLDNIPGLWRFGTCFLHWMRKQSDGLLYLFRW